MNVRDHAVHWSLTAVLSAAVAACGGGGGGEGGAPPVQTAPTLALTTANRDIVSHDAVAGAMSLASTTSLPLGGVASLASGESARDAALSRSTSWSARMLSSALGHLRSAYAASSRPRALAAYPPLTEPCTVSGTTTTTVDDRDNDGTVSVGDVGTVVFTHCMDTATETIDGTTSLQFSQVDANYLGAHLTLTGMKTVTPGHSLTVDGAMLIGITSSSPVLTIISATGEGRVQAVISTHVPFLDTVTLEDGFVTQETVDLSIAPPAGAGLSAGRTLTTLSGRMHSAAANGTFDIATVGGAPITRYHAEDYPRAGVLQVTGASGQLVLTATSASTVMLDLDWNDDGRNEVSEPKTWDWLI